MPVLTIEPAKFSPDAVLIYPKIFSFVNSFMVFDRLILFIHTSSIYTLILAFLSRCFGK